MEQILIAIYALIGLAALIGAVKAIDWAIGQKYKTKDSCTACQSSCREKIYSQLNGNKDLLIKLNTNMELLMGNFQLVVKKDESKK